MYTTKYGSVYPCVIQDGKTALFVACWKGHRTILNTLLQQHASIDICEEVWHVHGIHNNSINDILFKHLLYWICHYYAVSSVLNTAHRMAGLH